VETVRPIRQGGKRCGSPGETPARASSGGKAACPVVRSCRRTSRAGHWLRLTVRARSGVLAGARRLEPRHGRGWTGRKRTRVLRHLSAPDGRPLQAGSFDGGLKSPGNGCGASARPWSGQPRRPAPPPGHAGSAGSAAVLDARAYAQASTCSGSLNEFPIGSRPYASPGTASLQFPASRGGTMAAAGRRTGGSPIPGRNPENSAASEIAHEATTSASLARSRSSLAPLPKEHQQAGGPGIRAITRRRPGCAAATRPGVGHACAVVAYCPGVRSRYRASSRQ
jgi:hypothetical protein